jgi:AcrR family transcriptional regulator
VSVQIPRPTSDRIDGRALRHQHRRPEIVAALAEYILEFGLAEFSLRPAAVAVGVTHATLLRHFESKEALVHEVVDKIRADIVMTTVGAGVPPASRVTKLEDFVFDVWKRLTSGSNLRQFPLLYELVSDLQYKGVDRNQIRGSLSQDLTVPIAQTFMRHFGLSADEADTVTTLVMAQYRGAAVELILTRDEARADRAMRRFAQAVAADVRSRDGSTTV